MAWSGETSSTQLTSITTEQIFSEKPQLNPRELAHVEIDINFPGTPVDDAIVAVYGSLDGTNYDDTPFLEFVIDNGADPNQVSFQVIGVFQFQVGVRRSGTTDTITTADMKHKLDGVSA